MIVNFDNVEMGVVVNLATLREVLKGLSKNGKSWWIKSRPEFAIEDREVIIGYGDPSCEDELNTITYRVPVLSDAVPLRGTDRIVLLMDPSMMHADQTFLELEDGRYVQDQWEDVMSFFEPIRESLITRMRTLERPE